MVILIWGISEKTVRAEPEIRITVKTVLASQEAEFADPRLSDLIRELKTIFKYSSYRLLSQNRMNLKMKETGQASLPEERILKITPSKIAGNRVELQLAISRKENQIFQTVIQLMNRGAVTVGGPTYKGGYLLFNISASF